MGYVLAGAVMFALALSILSDGNEKPRKKQNSKSEDEWRLLEEYLASEDEDEQTNLHMVTNSNKGRTAKAALPFSLL